MKHLAFYGNIYFNLNKGEAMEFIKIVIPAFSACMCNAIANYFWKTELAKNPFNISSLSKIISLFFCFNIIIGIFFYIISMMLFLYMLSNFKLSLIVPLTVFTYVLNILSAYIIFREKIYTQSIIGTVVIILGIIILSQTPIGISK